MKQIVHLYRITWHLLELLLLGIFMCNMWVYSLTNGRIYSKISKIPARETALVLGTSPKMKSGAANPYFISRMNATAQLYHFGKIKKIIVSGEKSKGYDEPKAMKRFLVYQEGIPEVVITEDPLGYSTQTSIKRSKEIYHKKNLIIVSQGFHNLRAIFYARNSQIDALGFEARDVEKPESYYRNQGREILARVQAVVYYFWGWD